MSYGHQQLHKVACNCETMAPLGLQEDIDNKRIGREHVFRDHTNLLAHDDA